MAHRSHRSRASCVFVVAGLLLIGSAGSLGAQDLPRGTIIDSVTCAADPAQSYALYLPSSYSPDRAWSLLLAFHPAARGRLMVEKYAAAAEQYGYVVAASNTSRNGPWSVSTAAVQAMSADVGQRFSIDVQRLYLTGLSGGARVALQVALTNKQIAGVIASSGGYPDNKPRTSVDFALFGTAGTEDFNYIEMRLLDRRLTTPHSLAVFDGGHTLPPDEVALEAIEWMEVRAMQSGRRPRDTALVDRLFEKRQRRIAAAASAAEQVHLLEALVSDFTGLRDVTAEATRARELSKQPAVKKALARERDADSDEARMLGEIFDLEAALSDESRHDAALGRLRDRLSTWARAAAAADESPGRSQARRLLRAITAGAAGRVEDPAYRRLLEEYAARRR